MSIIEQATKRLEELRRAGVAVPWAAAGLAESDFLTSADANGDPRLEDGSFATETETESISVVRKAGHPDPSLGAAKKNPQRSEATRSPRRSAHVKLDLDQLGRAGFLVPNQARSKLAEEFRLIKLSLLKNVRGDSPAPIERGNLIMITSALPGEGKTFCAINLAMSLAMEMDTSVLLIDADAVRPTLLNRLGLPPAKGLLDVLTDRNLDLSEVLLRTNIPKLSLLPSGTPSIKSTELLASAAMEQLLAEVATIYTDRVVIFDAPPLLQTTEARVLASRMGQIVIVVEASRTMHSEVSQAIAAVEHCPIVMSVLNKCRVPAARSGFGYDL
jgi:protein-tyrosine kinase